MPITPEEVKSILDTFPDADTSIVQSILYFDGWKSYEEFGGVLVFLGIDDSFQVADYGDSIFYGANAPFSPREVSEQKALHLIKEMQKFLSTFDWPKY